MNKGIGDFSIAEHFPRDVHCGVHCGVCAVVRAVVSTVVSGPVCVCVCGGAGRVV